MNRQNRGTTALFATLSVLMVVGFSDTAQGQTVLDFNGSTAAPTLNFTVSSGLTATQQIVVTSNTGTTIAVNTNSNTASTPNWTGAPSWLTITPSVNPPNTPVTLTFKVNTLSPWLSTTGSRRASHHRNRRQRRAIVGIHGRHRESDGGDELLFVLGVSVFVELHWSARLAEWGARGDPRGDHSS